MFTNYIKKHGIILPSAVLHLNQKEYASGKAIDGQLEIRGRFIKNVLKRYEIDLVRNERNNDKEELLNSSSVYCSRECFPNKKDILHFILNVPENACEKSNQYTYNLVVRLVWENSQILVMKQPLVIQEV